MKKAAYTGVLAALGVVFGYLEMMIPLPINVPGVKIGLSNIAVVVALYLVGEKEALGISLIKALACGMLFWGAQGTVYAVFGSVFSFVSMIIVKRTDKFSPVALSAVGAVMHNLGQLTALRIFSGSFSFAYYMSVLGLSALFMGTVTGIISNIIIKRLKKVGKI